MMEERYIAAMVLSGVGDALGYKNGSWEFNHSGKSIHEELHQLGGLEKITVSQPRWMVSDDTVMHIATAEALVALGYEIDYVLLYKQLSSKYKDCMKNMSGRAPGATCMNGAHMLKPNLKNGHHIPFNPRGGGCGAAMRAMCIGLRFPRADNLLDLITVSIESGRMTHNHPTGFLGSLCAALFTSYAIQGKPVIEWGAALMTVLPKALEYVKTDGRDVKENEKHWDYFMEKWAAYLLERKISDGKSAPVFPKRYNVAERDVCYKKWSFSGWAGASGHDSVMIAYDALLGAGDSWIELCNRGMFHGGDSDSTGVIAAAWFGALYGFKGVPKLNYERVEFVDVLTNVGKRLHKLAMVKNILVYQPSLETEQQLFDMLQTAPDVPAVESPTVETATASD
ncbi:ADP-ribosylhydrolase ARH1-like [Tubulanus polymorphus]|uniref:ADP-ribosylhydrolase ARH1-like n=1 Tax=Tubulanus polymorphus TaxID=672921 RepID=UPI003DA35341